MRIGSIPEAVWTGLAAIAATALFHYHLLIYLAVFLVAVLGGGVPWMVSGSPGDKRLARIAVIGVTVGGILGIAWLTADRWAGALLTWPNA